MSGQASTAKTARIEFRVTAAKKEQWVKQAGSRTLSDYLTFLADRDADPEGQYVPEPMRKPVASQVEATRTAVAQLTPKQQKTPEGLVNPAGSKADPVSAVGRGFSTPVSDQVDVFFKATPAPKGRR